MAGLRQLDGGDEYPQERMVLLSGTLPRPVVEVQTGTPMIIHVVEPVVVEHPHLNLDDLIDVDARDALAQVAYALRRPTLTDPFELVPTVDAEGLVLRVELGAPGGVAQLDDDGKLRPAQIPDPPVPGWVHTQFIAAAVWSITHDLGFDPGGVLVAEGTGPTAVLVEPDRVLYPVAGSVVELHFGTPDNPIPIAGTARLS